MSASASDLRLRRDFAKVFSKCLAVGRVGGVVLALARVGYLCGQARCAKTCALFKSAEDGSSAGCRVIGCCFARKNETGKRCDWLLLSTHKIEDVARKWRAVQCRSSFPVHHNR